MSFSCAFGKQECLPHKFTVFTHDVFPSSLPDASPWLVLSYFSVPSHLPCPGSSRFLPLSLAVLLGRRKEIQVYFHSSNMCHPHDPDVFLGWKKMILPKVIIYLKSCVTVFRLVQSPPCLLCLKLYMRTFYIQYGLIRFSVPSSY